MIEFIIISAFVALAVFPFVLSFISEKEVNKMTKEKFVEKASSYIRKKDLVSFKRFIKLHIGVFFLHNSYIVERLTAVAAEVDGAQKVDSADNK